MMETTNQVQTVMDPEMMAELTEMLAEMAAVLPAMIGTLLIGFILWRAVLGLVSRRVMKNRGGKGGFWWGFFLGVVGIIVEAVRPKE